MCGIIGGIFNKNYNIENSLKILKKRGPDNTSLIINNSIFIGHTLFSLFSDTNANQPFISNDKKLICSVNGEIYNYKELKNILTKKGYIFNTNSDCEVIVHGYSMFKDAIFEKLDGEYCCIIYDLENDLWKCAVDEFGTKPLRYYYFENQFVVASTIESINELGISLEFDTNNVLFSLLSQCLPENKTLFKNVYSISPGNILTFKNNSLTTKQISKYSNDSEIIINENYIESLLNESILKRVNTNKKIALTLSSGIDSSLLAYYCKKNKIDLKTFSIGFENSNFSEKNDIVKFVNKHNLNNEIIEINEYEIINNFKESIINAENIVINPHCSAKNILNKHMKNQNFNIVLSGHGADEMFFGYSHFHTDKKLQFLHNSLKSGTHILFLLKKEFKETYFNQLNNIKNEFIGDDRYLYTKYWLNEYGLKILGDSQSSSIAQEYRYPYLDKKLVNYLYSIKNFKTHNYPSKTILRNITKKWDYDCSLIVKKPFKSYDINEKWLELFNQYELDDFIFDTSKLRNYIMTLKLGGDNNKLLLTQILSLGILNYKFIYK